MVNRIDLLFDLHTYHCYRRSWKYTLREGLVLNIYLRMVLFCCYTVTFAIGSVRFCDLLDIIILKSFVFPLFYFISYHIPNSMGSVPVSVAMATYLFITSIYVPPNILYPASSQLFCIINIWGNVCMLKRYLACFSWWFLTFTHLNLVPSVFTLHKTRGTSALWLVWIS